MFCANCGANIPEGTAVCPVCGAAVENGVQRGAVMQGDVRPAYESAQPMTGPQPVYAGGQPAAGLYQADPQPAYESAQPEKPQRSAGYAVAALVLVFLSALTCVIPFVSLPLALISLIFAVLGLHSEHRPMARVALVLSIVFLIWNAAVTVIAVIYMKKYGFTMDHIRYFIENYIRNFFR